MYCCENCFQNEWLRECIREGYTHEGQCDFCKNDDTNLVHISSLTLFLRNTLDVYHPLQYGVNYGPEDDPLYVGESLISLIQDDWQVFDDELVELGKANQLLEEILNWDWDDDSGESPINANDLYSYRKALWHSSPAEDWGVFCDDVRDKSDLEPVFSKALEIDIWDHAKEINSDKYLFRARQNWDSNTSDFDKQPYIGIDIEAPPPENATAGRVNEKGIPMLYVSEKEKTAVAEVRPPRGSLVSVGVLCLTRNVKILDLGDSLPEPNPFITEQLAYQMEHVELLNSFSWVLSKPLERTDEVSEYRPSQKLSTWLKGQGFDGIRYASAMSSGGHNIVFFDPKVAKYSQSSLKRITNVSICYDRYEDVF